VKWSTSIAAVLILTCAHTVPAEAQNTFPQVLCDQCRDPNDFPRDYRNFAYNQLFAPDAWMTYSQGDFFQVLNPQGQYVFIDMNMDLDVFTLDLGIPIPLPFPIAVQIQVILIYENGDQKIYMMDPRAHADGLPVGRRTARGGAGGGGFGSSGSSGGRGSERPSAGSGTRTCGITRVDGGKARRTCI
jgi:hypothetical protein